MAMNPDDRLVGSPRGSVDSVVMFMRENARIGGLGSAEEYAAEVYRLAPIVGIDPAIVIAQSSHETGKWTSSWWVNRRNPAGIGITGDPEQNAVSHTWHDGTEAAQSHIAHLLLYNFGAINRGGLTPADDPRYDAYVAAYGPNKSRASTIADLAGQWAVDKNYAAGIVNHAAAIFGDLPDQQTGGPVPGSTIGVPVTMIELPRSAANRPETKLPATGQLHIVVHETGNTNAGADAVSQIRYMQSAEAQSRRASYHLSVDDHQIIQGIPLDEIAWHAGDGCDNPAVDIGCFRSIAIETCVNRDGDKAQTRRNLAELIARLCAGDPAFDWGGGSSRKRFDIDHLLQHHDVSDDGKNCPMQIRDEGFWPTLMTWVDQAWAIWGSGAPTPGPTYAIPAKPSWWTSQKASGYPENRDLNGVRFFGLRTEMTVNKATVQRATASAKGKESGPALVKGTRVLVEGIFRNPSGKWVLAAEDKTMKVADAARIALKDLSENINVTERP